IAAAERLFNKKLIDQVDGGYLTPLGRTSAEHAQSLSSVLNGL
ncbi:TIGR02647 family protein, partial [Cycloclasticus sp. 46_83_sub15_T18]